MVLDNVVALAPEWLQGVGTVIGLAVLAKLVFECALAVLTALLRPPRKIMTKFGEWAVVTGATDGIGKAYACELAKSKMNVVLISRTKAKLDAVAAEIREDSKVEVEVVAADLGESSSFAAVEEALKDKDVGVLVNNVGISYDYPDELLNIEDKRIDQLISLNVTALTKMSKIVLGGMKERKRGAIVNISSISGSMPMSLLSVYSATKAYVDFFSQGLATEYAGDNIVVQTVLPAFVSTKMSKIRRASLMVPTPKTYAKNAVDTIGNFSRTGGYIWHDLQLGFLGMLPSWLATRQLHQMHLSIRKKALKKLETARSKAE
jgi:17beta-estradiol 17-dehydrogenase / very-long-chain 3-oxoacyl-CoA reductase